VPRYLRWIVAITSGVTAQLLMVLVLGSVFVGRGTAGEEQTTITDVGQGVGLLFAVVAPIVVLLAALAINDWLATRYPLPRREPDRVG